MPAIAFAVSAACVGPRATRSEAPSVDYVVEAPSRAPFAVRVEARLVATGAHRVTFDARAAPFVRDFAVDEGSGFHAADARAALPACARRCAVRYAIDLEALAAACGDDLEGALRSRDAVLSPALAWLARPSPAVDAPVTVRVRAADPARFATGLRASLRTGDLDEGSFTAFGAMRSARLDVRGATLDVALLGPPLAMGDDATLAWIDAAARCEATLFRRFPVDRAQLFVVPMEGSGGADRGPSGPGEDRDEVLSGKVLALAGPSLALLAGRAMRVEDARRDEVLQHELFHLGFPSFRGAPDGEERGLGEGLATYYEPVLRARCGFSTPEDAWRALVAKRDDADAIYWGGALFALASDVAIRRETGGARSLDDALRAVLARGGDASRVWTLDDVLREGDRATGTRVLTATRARLAGRGEPFEAAALLEALGVVRDAKGAVQIRDDAPLAAIRRAITAPARE